MVTQPPLATSGAVKRRFLALDFLVDSETVQQHLRLLSADMPLLDERCARCPRQRNRRIVDVKEAVAVAESILSQNHMLTPLAQHADEYAPTLDGHVYPADAVREAFADAGVAPFYADEVACG